MSITSPFPSWRLIFHVAALSLPRPSPSVLPLSVSWVAVPLTLSHALPLSFLFASPSPFHPLSMHCSQPRQRHSKYFSVRDKVKYAHISMTRRPAGGGEGSNGDATHRSSASHEATRTTLDRRLKSSFNLSVKFGKRVSLTYRPPAPRPLARHQQPDNNTSVSAPCLQCLILITDGVDC